MDLLAELGKIFFGFILGFISHLYWDCRNQKREKERQIKDEKKEDKRILRDVRRVLLEINRTWKTTTPPRHFTEHMDELSQLCMEIKRKENKMIKLKIWKFSGKFRETPAHSFAIPEVKELRKEAEELRNQVEAILGIEQSMGDEK